MDRGEPWVAALLEELARTGRVGAEAVQFVRDQNIRVRLRNQSSGARWILGRRIELHPRYAKGPPSAPYGLSLVVHEVQHARQGWARALSVYGELEAWQVQFAFLRTLVDSYPGSPEQQRLITDLVALPLGWDREVLRVARTLMRRYAGRAYRVDLLPLYPLPLELAYLITRRPPAVVSES